MPWTQLFPVHSPSVRITHLMAFDAARDVVVLWGGYRAVSGFTPVNWDYTNVYEWDGSDWATITPAHTPPTNDTSGNLIGWRGFCYDGTTGKMLLVGVSQTTSSGPYFFNHWVWDGSDWAEVLPTHKPTPFYANLTIQYHDGVNKTFLLGAQPSPLGTAGGYVWQWDGTDWTYLGQLLPTDGHTPTYTPNTSDDQIWSYDPQLDKLVLVTTGSLNHTYLFDGTAFTIHTPADMNTPQNRTHSGNHALSGYSDIVPSRKGIIQYCGNYPGDTFSTRTFQFVPPCDGGDYVWQQLSPPPADPGQRALTGVCRNVGGSIVLFGGSTTRGLTLTLANDTWSFEPLPCDTPGNPVFRVRYRKSRDG